MGDELLFAKRLEFLSPPLATSPKSPDGSKTSKAVFGEVANVIYLNG